LQGGCQAASGAGCGGLGQRYAGRELTVVDVSEVQLEGAVHCPSPFRCRWTRREIRRQAALGRYVNGKVDGAWELSDNLMELRLRHLEPKRKLVLTIDAGCARSMARP